MEARRLVKYERTWGGRKYRLAGGQWGFLDRKDAETFKENLKQRFGRKLRTKISFAYDYYWIYREDN